MGQEEVEPEETETLVDKTTEKEALMSCMHARVKEFVDVRADLGSLQAALLRSQDLIRQVRCPFFFPLWGLQTLGSAIPRCWLIFLERNI